MTEPHSEPHSGGSSLSDVILGGQDGLVNVLGIILGVTASGADMRIIIAAGLAATFAESISMGAVGYTSTLARADYYEKEKRREIWEMENKPDAERQEIRDIYAAKGFEGELLERIVTHITSDKQRWLDTMMREELHLEPVEKRHAFRSAFIIFIAAFIGSLIPLIPYFFLTSPQTALYYALGISILSLFLFGAYSARVTVGNWARSGIQLMLIGMLAALAGYIIGAFFNVEGIG